MPSKVAEPKKKSSLKISCTNLCENWVTKRWAGGAWGRLHLANGGVAGGGQVNEATNV